MSINTDQTFRLAALDLGSNSFHLIIAGLNQGEVRIKDKISEKVQLGAGIGPDKRISEEAQDRALDCLQRYAERLQGIPKECCATIIFVLLSAPASQHFSVSFSILFRFR